MSIFKYAETNNNFYIAIDNCEILRLPIKMKTSISPSEKVPFTSL